MDDASLSDYDPRIDKAKKFLKRQNHKKNRAVAKKLDTVHIRLDGWALD